MKEWMAQVDPPKEASTFERMNGRPQPLFLNKRTHYFTEWRLHVVFRKKNIILIMMLRIDPLNSSCSQKLQYPVEN